MVSCEACVFTEILVFSLAEPAPAARRMKPGNANSFSFFKAGGIIPTFLNNPHNLMARNYGQFDLGKFAFYCMKVSMTDATNFDSNEYVLRASFRGGEVNKL